MILWKICGITNLEDAKLAVTANASIIGCVFHPNSKRYCHIDTAILIQKEFPNRPLAAVFAYNQKSYIESIMKKLFNNDILNKKIFLQLPFDHESFDEIEGNYSHNQITPVILMHSEFNWQSMKNKLNLKHKKYPYLIFDTGGMIDSKGEKIAGGTGVTFNWNLIHGVDYPYLIAGGINPENVSQAISHLDIEYGWGIDISGGIELSPGKKDPRKINEMSNFFQYKKLT